MCFLPVSLIALCNTWSNNARRITATVSCRFNIHSSSPSMKSDRCERHRSRKRVLAVHQSSGTTDTLPQCRGGAACCEYLLCRNVSHQLPGDLDGSGAPLREFISNHPLITSTSHSCRYTHIYLYVHVFTWMHFLIKLLCHFSTMTV